MCERDFVLELIETLWNVNYIGGDFYRTVKKELIETLWNVNITNNDYCIIV